MAIPGKGCFVAWYDLQPGEDAGHDHWHTHEHMIERVAIPGFLRGFRYRSLTGSPRTCVVYHAEKLETLNSSAYVERLNNPTPWSERTLPQMTGMNRTMCSVAASHGFGIGGYLLTVQVSAAAGREVDLRSWLSGQVLADLAGRAGLCGAHFLIGDRGVSDTPTQEKELRGKPDEIADWIVLVEGYDRAAAEQAKAELLGADGLVGHGAAEPLTAGLYSLDYSLGEEEAKRIWRKP
jgi:hypothetical protein